MKVQPALQRRLWAAAAVVAMLVFSAINAKQRWLIERQLPIGTYGNFLWDALPLVVYGLVTLRALRPGPAHAPPERVEIGPRHDPLLLLRAFACFMVLGGHGVGFAFEAKTYIADLAAGLPVWLLAPSPYCGVWIFFVLSGYLIGKGFNSGRYDAVRVSVAGFMLNRCLRILPVYWLMIGSNILFAHVGIFKLENLPVFLSVMALSVDGRYPFMPIGALWSISTEMQFYVLAPMLFVALSLREASLARCIVMGLVTILLELTLRVIVTGHFGPHGYLSAIYMPLIGNLDLFLLGMLTSRVVIQARARGWGLSSGLAVGWLVMLAVYAAMSWLYTHALYLDQAKPGYMFGAFATTIAGIASAVAIFCFELAPIYANSTRIYRWGRPLEMLGVLTYAMYSLHEPIFLAIRVYLPSPPNMVVSVIFFLSVSAALLVPAFALHRYVEKPFLKLKWRTVVVAPSGE